MKLFIFDVDDTVAARYTTDILPGVREWFAKIDWASTRIAFATNQGGVGLRYWMESQGFGDPSQYPTEGDVLSRLDQIEQELVPPTHELQSEIYAAFAYQSKAGNWSPAPDNRPCWSREWRKPNAGMLRQAMADAGVLAADTVFVGNGDEDRQAAQAAGIEFVEAKEFFSD